ncbi:MAG: hypothetical protein WDN04_22855 [Rhodospirillales bacterium]
MQLSIPDTTVLVRREAARLCRHLGWAPLHEVALPNGRARGHPGAAPGWRLRLCRSEIRPGGFSH